MDYNKLNDRIDKLFETTPIEHFLQDFIDMGYIVKYHDEQKSYRGLLWNNIISYNPFVSCAMISCIRKNTPYNVFDYSSTKDYIIDNSVFYMLAPGQEKKLPKDCYNKEVNFIVIKLKSEEYNDSTEAALII